MRWKRQTVDAVRQHNPNGLRRIAPAIDAMVTE